MIISLNGLKGLLRLICFLCAGNRTLSPFAQNVV